MGYPSPSPSRCRKSPCQVSHLDTLHNNINLDQFEHLLHEALAVIADPFFTHQNDSGWGLRQLHMASVHVFAAKLVLLIFSVEQDMLREIESQELLLYVRHIALLNFDVQFASQNEHLVCPEPVV